MMTSPPPRREPALLYQDEALLAVDKPAGMLVHRGWAQDDEVLTDWVRRLTGAERVHPIHRLDRNTSGLVLFARHRRAARHLNAQFAARQVFKHYIALVRGVPPPSGYIDHPVAPEPRSKARVEAQSSYRRLALCDDSEPRACALVEVVPHTGRVHQVRRHMSRRDHPLIGDAVYGKGSLNRAFKARYGVPRLALHAVALRLEHPDTSRPLCLISPLAPELAESFERIGFEPACWRALEEPDLDRDWLKAARASSTTSP